MLDFYFFLLVSEFFLAREKKVMSGYGGGEDEKKQVQTGLHKITVGPVSGFLGMCNVHF